MKHSLTRLSVLVILFLATVDQANAQSAESSKPLDVFKPFIGNWAAPDTAKIYKMDPSRKGTYFFGFRMIGKSDQVYMLEDFGPGKKDTVFVGLITPNPLTGQLEMFGSNVKDGFLFKGFIEDVSPNGFTRHYDVFYPKDHPVSKQAGQMVSYREKFVLLNKNTMEFDVEFIVRRPRLGGSGHRASTSW